MKEGDEITIVVKTPLCITEEKCKIEEIKGDNIYVEGQEIPFDVRTGKKIEYFFGSIIYIKEICTIK